MRRSSLLLCAAGLLSLNACADDPQGNGEDIEVTDTSDATDTQGDSTEPGDTAPDADACGDACEEDTTPQGPFDPQAKIFRIDPLTTPDLTQVTLEHLDNEGEALEGPYARVRSCSPDLENGATTPMDLGGLSMDLTVCVPEFKAKPGKDGTYLHLLPPATPDVDDGRFAELMMYHHMQVIHDYFDLVHDLDERDTALDAITNIQVHVEIPGFCSEWAQIANAAFVPEGGLEELGDAFGADFDFGIEGDVIIFSGTDSKNFAFDASVIYHEYVHAILGSTRLNAIFADDQGLNNLPGALNEAFADYFAATITDESAMGQYALSEIDPMSFCGFPLGEGGDAHRDLEVQKSCPADLTAEVHADSEIFSNAIWQIRKTYGPSDADKVILAGVLTLTQTSDFDDAANAIIDAAEDILGEEARAQVQTFFEERGLLGCQRVLPIEAVGQKGLPLSLEGSNSYPITAFGSFIPGYLQISFEVPESATQASFSFEIPQGGLFGGEAPPELKAALKAGGELISYDLRSRSHDAEFEIELVNGAFTLVADEGTTLTPGPWVLSLHNYGEMSSVSGASVSFTTDSD